MRPRTRTHPNSAGGRWAWRDYLPSDEAEYQALTGRLLTSLLDGSAPAVNVPLFAGWVRAEMNGDESVALSSTTAAKFRRLLYELTVEDERGPSGRQRRREAGHAHLSLVTAAGSSSGAAMAMANGQIGLALVLFMLAPVILDEPRYVEPEQLAA